MGSNNLHNGDLSPNGDLNGSTPKIYGANPPPAWSSRKYNDPNLKSHFTNQTMASTICLSLGELTVNPNDSDVTWRSDGHF